MGLLSGVNRKCKYLRPDGSVKHLSLALQVNRGVSEVLGELALH